MIRSVQPHRIPWLFTIEALAGVGVLAGVLALPSAPAHADATSPACASPSIASGTITPAMPGLLVNTGTTTVTVTAKTTSACGYAGDGTLHYWAADPTWHEASTAGELGASPKPATTVTKDEATGTTDTTYAATVPASGEVWVGVKYLIPDKASDLGFGVNESALIPTRIAVRTPPVINPPSPLLPHDNDNTLLTGKSWPGDQVTVKDKDGKVICTAVADDKGNWSCTADETFPNGKTELTVCESGTGPNNPDYPGLSDQDLPDLCGNTVETAVITADPAVTKDIDNDRPVFGEEVTYTVVATNNGPNTAVDVTVDDALPDGLEYISHTATAGTFDPTTGAWTGIGDLDKGEKQTLTIRAKVTKRGTITNPAKIKATGATDGDQISRLTGDDGIPDWNLDATNDDDKAVLVTTPASDPQLTKAVDKPSLHVGDIAVYTLEASNNGPDTAMGVSVSELAPAGIEVVSATPDTGTFDEATGTWTIGDLPVGTTATLRVRARITAAGRLENLAEIHATGATDGDITSPRGDIDTTNNKDVAAVVTEPTTSLPVTTEPEAALPVTGTRTASAVGAAVVSLSAGVGLVLLTRRRRWPHHQ